MHKRDDGRIVLVIPGGTVGWLPTIRGPIAKLDTKTIKAGDFVAVDHFASGGEIEIATIVRVVEINDAEIVLAGDWKNWNKEVATPEKAT